MVLKKYPPLQDSFFKICQEAFSMNRPVPSDQFKKGHIIQSGSKLLIVTTSLTQNKEESQASEKEKDDEV